MPDHESKHSSDAELIRALADRRREALRPLVARHAASVRRLALAMTRDEDTADDVVQEVFVAAWRSAQTFRGDSSVRNWLLTITRNAARRTTRRRAGEPAKTEDLDQLAEAAGWGQGDMSPDFERALESRELLIAGMARLSADDGELVTLVDLEGLSLREAAGVLDLQLPTLKSRLHRARIRLIAALEEVSA